MRVYLLIALGSLCGANVRYYLSVLAADRWGTGFPYGTLFINTTGSFLLGWFLPSVAARFGNSGDARALVATGFCGAYTTFSTFAYETIALTRQRDHWPALVNALGSALLGIGAAATGVLLASMMGR